MRAFEVGAHVPGKSAAARPVRSPSSPCDMFAIKLSQDLDLLLDIVNLVFRRFEVDDLDSDRLGCPLVISGPSAQSMVVLSVSDAPLVHLSEAALAFHISFDARTIAPLRSTDQFCSV